MERLTGFDDEWADLDLEEMATLAAMVALDDEEGYEPDPIQQAEDSGRQTHQ